MWTEFTCLHCLGLLLQSARLVLIQADCQLYGALCYSACDLSDICTNKAYSFPQAAKFRAEPWNLPFFCGILMLPQKFAEVKK